MEISANKRMPLRQGIAYNTKHSEFQPGGGWEGGNTFPQCQYLHSRERRDVVLTQKNKIDIKPKQLECFGFQKEKEKRKTQVARSFNDCPKDCFWQGSCLNGTKFDDGNGALKASSFVPWINFSYYSPCFLNKRKTD